MPTSQVPLGCMTGPVTVSQEKVLRQLIMDLESQLELHVERFSPFEIEAKIAQIHFYKNSLWRICAEREMQTTQKSDGLFPSELESPTWKDSKLHNQDPNRMPVNVGPLEPLAETESRTRLCSAVKNDSTFVPQNKNGCYVEDAAGDADGAKDTEFNRDMYPNMFNMADERLGVRQHPTGGNWNNESHASSLPSYQYGRWGAAQEVYDDICFKEATHQWTNGTFHQMSHNPREHKSYQEPPFNDPEHSLASSDDRHAYTNSCQSVANTSVAEGRNTGIKLASE
jgi:hypothetical protein